MLLVEFTPPGKQDKTLLLDIYAIRAVAVPEPPPSELLVLPDDTPKYVVLWMAVGNKLEPQHVKESAEQVIKKLRDAGVIVMLHGDDPVYYGADDEIPF